MRNCVGCHRNSCHRNSSRIRRIFAHCVTVFRMPFDPNASFGKSLFFGDILEDQLFPYPEMPRDQAELVAPICETIDKYMREIDHRKLDRVGEFPKELLQSLREMGLFGLIVPEEHGGLGLSNTGYA